jgi:hypothetical protein
MNEGAWSRFLEYAAHARTKPTFDLEERQPKLDAAVRLRRALEVARDGGDWRTLLAEALRPLARNPFEAARNRVVPPRHSRWMNDWARQDAESLRLVLTRFLEDRDEPVARFARFAEAGERIVPPGDERAATIGRSATLTVGSLLGFALEPDKLPIVRAPLRRLQELLGREASSASTPVELYADQLEFANYVCARVKAHPIPVRDMLDVQALVQIGVREQALWASGPAAVPEHPVERNLSPDAAYLAACAIYLNEAPYLHEWIEFHRLVGVERFFLYDNGSTDGHLEVLSPYIERGIVSLHAWEPAPPDQREVYDHCLRSHRADARWIAFLDIDEFLFSPTGKSVAEVLRDYERWPGVGVNWAMFSHSGHRTAPEGLVIESYPLRDRAETGLIKCIVDPMRTVRCDGAHWFTYDRGLPVDENHWPIAEGQTMSTSFERLRINHYASRSEEELREKIERRSGWMHLRGWRRLDLEGELELVRDETIAEWVPALEAALRRGDG